MLRYECRERVFLPCQAIPSHGWIFECDVRRRGAPLVPRKRYEPNRRRAEGRWRKGMNGRIKPRNKLVELIELRP